jgi:hypothetical protein
MWDSIPGLERLTETFALPVWAAGAAIILLLITGVIALRRAGPGATFGNLSQVVIAVILAGASLIFPNESSQRDRAGERRALDARAMELTARAVTPGSPLACLDGLAGETIENACEKALFASAESAASAVSYIAARLALLADAVAYADKRDPSYEPVLADWRRKLEADRFGVVAHVLTTRDGCNNDHCETFRLLSETSRVTANLKEGAFDQYVARHAAAWETRASTPVAATTAPSAPATTSPSLASSSSSGPIFPSSASIPPISIMNTEPTGSMPPGVGATMGPAGPNAATATADPIGNVPTPPRRPPRRPPNPTAGPAADPAAPAQ